MVAVRAVQHRVHHRTNLKERTAMPQTNDAELTELYTTPTNEEVEDNEPNSGPPGQASAANFNLRLQAVAGNAVGNSAANYTLRIDCIDDTLAAPNGGMSPGTLNQAFNAVNLWNLGGGNTGNYVNEQTFLINVDNAAKGHVLHYVATMVSVNGDIVSFIESNRFILV
jgi:hypothetical protein